MTRGFVRTALAVPLLLVACGGSSSTTAPRAVPSTTSRFATTTPVVTASSTAASSTTAAAVAADIVNQWVGPAVDLTALPLGDSRVSTTTAAAGGLYACRAGNPNGGGAFKAGPWIDEAAKTWNKSLKVSVQGRVDWPMAKYSETVANGIRAIASSGLPVGYVTGTFPIAASDPAFAYDRNQNTITQHDTAYTLPVTPAPASSPGCLSGGAVAILRNGVVAFAPLDQLNRDAVAWETQDECDGHPQEVGVYHYHDIPSCLLTASTGSSTVVGFAIDGYPIVVERDPSGALPSNADLDECHGRTSPVLLDGQVLTTYHYSATHEFPYFIGCFHGKQGSQ